MYNVRELTSDEMCEQVLLLGSNIIASIQDMIGVTLTAGIPKISSDRISPTDSLTVFTSFSGVVQGEYFFSICNENVSTLLGNERSSFEIEDLMDGFFEELLNISVGQTIEQIKDTYAYLTFSSPRISIGQLILPEYHNATIPLLDSGGKVFGECKFSLNMAKIEITDKLLTTMKKLRNKTEASNIDPLTQVYNRTYYSYYVDKLFGRKQPLTMAIIDVDNFKTVNDTLGHSGGDNALKFIADILKKNARGTDLVVRFGGDEFVLFFESSELLGAEKYFDRVIDTLHTTPLIIDDGRSVSLTISAGVCEHITGEPFELFFDRVDCALYKAKDGGRDQIVIGA